MSHRTINACNQAKIIKVKHPLSVKVLPLFLSFATHPDFMEVGVPDPSFWSWPEMAVAPHWELLRDPDVVRCFIQNE